MTMLELEAVGSYGPESEGIHTSDELVIRSHRVVRYRAEESADLLAAVHAHGQADADLLLIRIGVTLTDPGDRKLSDGLAQTHRGLQPALRRHAPKQVVVASVRSGGGVSGRHRR